MVPPGAAICQYLFIRDFVVEACQNLHDA